MAFARSAGAGNEDVGLFLKEAAGGQVQDEGPVDGSIEGKVEAFQSVLALAAGPAQTHAELALFLPGDFVLDEHGQEVGVSELFLDGLTVADFQGVQDAGKPELFEQRGQLRHGVHTIPPFIAVGFWCRGRTGCDLCRRRAEARGAGSLVP